MQCPNSRLWRLKTLFVIAILLSSLPGEVSAQTKSGASSVRLSPLVATSPNQGPASNVRFTFASPAGGQLTIINLQASLLDKVREIYAGFWNPTTKQMVLLSYIEGIRYSQTLTITFAEKPVGKFTPTAFAIQPLLPITGKTALEAYTNYENSTATQRGAPRPTYKLEYGLGFQRTCAAVPRACLSAPAPAMYAPAPPSSPSAPGGNSPGSPPAPLPPSAPQPPAKTEPTIPPASTPCPECEVIEIVCVPTAPSGPSPSSFSPSTGSDPTGYCSDSMFLDRPKPRDKYNICFLCVGNWAFGEQMRQLGYCGKRVTRAEFKDIYDWLRNKLTPETVDRTLNGLTGSDLIDVISFILYLLKDYCELAEYVYHMADKFWCLHAPECQDRLSGSAHLNCWLDPKSNAIIKKLLEVLGDDRRFPEPNSLRRPRAKLQQFIEEETCQVTYRLGLFTIFRECICCLTRQGGPLTEEKCASCLEPYCGSTSSPTPPKDIPESNLFNCKQYWPKAKHDACTNFKEPPNRIFTINYRDSCAAYVREHANKNFSIYQPSGKSDALVCPVEPPPAPNNPQCCCNTTSGACDLSKSTKAACNGGGLDWRDTAACRVGL